MISLAGRDIMHAWGKFVFTGMGLGLLIGITLSMAGIYRGMVDDAKVLLDNSGADLWVVQKNTLGPYAEPSNIYDDIWRQIHTVEGVSKAQNVTYQTMQIRKDQLDIRALVTGIGINGPENPGRPTFLIAGRQITRSHNEAIADISSGLKVGDQIQIRRNHFTVVGLTRRMVSSSGDPMIFIPLKDAQEAQFLKDNEAIHQQRRRDAEEITPPGSFQIPLSDEQTTNHTVNAVLVKLRPLGDPQKIASFIEKWKGFTVYTRAQMEKILVGKLIATSAKQIFMFLVILSLVSAAIVAFIIYTLTIGKIREIAVLKLLGTRNRTIVSLILQQAIALGIIGFVVGKIAATLVMAPIFPKYVLLMPMDSIAGFVVVITICILSSLIAIRTALAVDPAQAIGG